MTKFINITEIRTKIADLAKNARSDQEVILLRNGKPTLVLVGYKEFEKYQEWKDKVKKAKIVKAIKNIRKEADRLGLGDKFVKEKGLEYKSLSEDELLDLVAND